MKDITDTFSKEGYDVVDLIPIPTRGDRMVRIRTLEEALDDFDSTTQGETVGYLVQVRAKGAQSSGASTGTAKSVLNQPLHSFEDDVEGDAVFSRLTAETFDQVKNKIAGPQPETAEQSDAIYHPDGQLNIPYLLHNAEILHATGEYALARNIYKTILTSGECSHLAHYWIGRCLESEGKLDEAQHSFDESITYQATLEAYQHLAALLIRRKKDQQAAETMERALTLRDMDRSTRFELHKACGNCWMRAQDFKKAELQYQSALEIDPTADSLQANLGALYLQIGNLASAKGHFQDALTANARNEKALAGLGSCFLAEGQKRQAHDHFAKSLDIHLNNPTAVFHLVKCAYEIKSYATAARIVGEYIQIAPVNANLMYSLAGLQYHLGRIAEARSTATKTLSLQPSHSGANELLKLIERYGHA